MRFSDQFLDAGTDIWNAQKNHSFVRKLAAGTLDDHGPELSDRRQARIDQLFQRTVDLEAAFFEPAYESTSDGTADEQEGDT